MEENLSAKKIRKMFKFPHRRLDMNDALALLQSAPGVFKLNNSYGIKRENWLEYLAHTTLVPVVETVEQSVEN